MGGEFNSLYHKSNKEALALFCYVVKHLRSGTQKAGGNTRRNGPEHGQGYFTCYTKDCHH